MSKLKVGIAGKRGLDFVAGFRALPQTEVVAFCEADAGVLERHAARHEIPLRYGRFDAMLDAVDIVVVATPMQLHAPHALMALQAGKHVLSEVPAAVSIEECWRLHDAARTARTIYMMAENYCYMRDNILIRAMARKGMFGELYFGEGEYLHEVRNLHHAPDGSPTWRYYWQVGINGNTYPTHSLGPVMQWFTDADPAERIEQVICVGTGRRTDPEHVTDDTTLMICRLASGKLINIRLDMLSNRPHHMAYYALQGTAGAYEASRLPGQPGLIWLEKNKQGHHREWSSLEDYAEHLPEFWKNPPIEAVKAGHGGGDFFEIFDFVNAICGEAPPAIDIHSSLEWTAAGLCSQISIANGGVPIAVPNFRDPVQRPIILDAPPIVI